MQLSEDKYRPDARHSSFWTDMMPMGIVYSIVVVIVVIFLNYLGIFEV